ncbi:MAG: hypothetical protein AB7I27_00025 [Bacteriovoracaceae bacterium]
MITRRSACTDLKERLAALTTESSLSTYPFSAVVSGLAGATSENGSLNSLYYSHFFKNIKVMDLERPHLFPQRVPRLGLFDEINEVSPELGLRITNIRSCLQDFFDNYLSQGPDLNSEWTELNFLKLALRYGVQINYQIEFNQYPKLHHLTLADFMINANVSLDEKLDLSPLLNILELNSEKSRLNIMNRIIVATSRYGQDFFNQNSDLFVQITQELDKQLASFPIESNLDKVSLASMYRGLPMSPYFEKEKTLLYLKKSEQILHSIEAASELELIAKKECLGTLYLTFSKYFLYQENSEILYRQCLENIIALDPFDPSAYGELALREFKLKNYSAAIELLRKCLDLGPPFLGMYQYYLGICLEELGDNTNAEMAYRENVKLDAFALSPKLRLFSLLKIKDPIKAKEVAVDILNNPDLYEQLTREEKCELENF